MCVCVREKYFCPVEGGEYIFLKKMDIDTMKHLNNGEKLVWQMLTWAAYALPFCCPNSQQ